MKAELLSVLRDADDYVSGQDLCEKFGVSRTAVWKGINQLKEAGYEIEAVPNKGYKLLSVPDTLSEEELKSIRKTAWVGQEIFYYPVIDSTNTRAKQLAEEDYPTGTLVVAGQQDAGRGRRGRSFESPQGAGIYDADVKAGVVARECADADAGGGACGVCGDREDDRQTGGHQMAE